MSGDWFDDEAIEAERFDADMQMAELQATARQHAEDLKNGHCHHDYTGRAKDPELKASGRFECYDCGAIFDTEHDRDLAMGLIGDPDDEVIDDRPADIRQQEMERDAETRANYGDYEAVDAPSGLKVVFLGGQEPSEADHEKLPEDVKAVLNRTKADIDCDFADWCRANHPNIWKEYNGE